MTWPSGWYSAPGSVAEMGGRVRKARPSLGSSEPGEKDAHSRMIQPGSSGDFQEGFLEEVPAELSLDG